MFIEDHWLSTKDGDLAALGIMRRHYSFRKYRDNRPRTLFVGPGQKIVLVTQDYSALFVWRKFKSDDGQQGVNCAAFHNESDLLASDLILEAEQRAWSKWPGARLYTYVNPRKIKKNQTTRQMFYQGGMAIYRTHKSASRLPQMRGNGARLRNIQRWPNHPGKVTRKGITMFTWISVILIILLAAAVIFGLLGMRQVGS